MQKHFHRSTVTIVFMVLGQFP